MRRYLNFLRLFFFILISLSFISLVHGEEVTFPDPNLEAAIREALNKPEGPITEEDLATLTELDASGRGIIDLTGIEYCINLEWLDLRGNQITDISLLSSLTNLQTLWSDHNQISDITPLSSLTNLQWLGLSSNQISDISLLSGLTNLWFLSLSGNQISDFSPLIGLTNLEVLHLRGSQISNISPLSNLIKLWELYLDGNQISNISPLSGLTNLKRLWLGGNQISDISPLSGLTNLRWLDLSNNQISDISPLVNNPGIGEGDEIDLRGNQLNIQKLQEKGATVILFDTQPFWRELHKPLAEQGYITEGLILEPLEDTAYNEWDIGIDLLESVGGEAEVKPREGDILIFREKEHRWKAYAFDIGNVFSNIFGEIAHATTYVVTYLRFEEEGEVDVWVGSDDDISVWMNDQNAWVNAVLRPWTPDEDKFTAQVKSGWNRLLVKVNNRGGGGWGYSVRFPNVNPVEVSLNPDVMRLVGDVSGNGAVTAYDAALIMQFAVGLIDHLPAPTDVEVSSSPHPFKLRIPQVKAHLGDEIRLPILVEDASGLFAGGLILRYDPSILEAEDVLAGTLRTYGSAGASPSLWKASVEEEGILRIAFANEGEMRGSGTLFEVKMRSIGEGESEIKVERADLFMDWGVKIEEGLVRVIPTETALLQNYPNPFNPETWIPFKLAEGSEVVIRLYDMAGRLVRMFGLGYVEAGSYTTRGRTVRWDGRNEMGERVANGTYIYQLQTGDRVFVKRLVVLK